MASSNLIVAGGADEPDDGPKRPAAPKLPGRPTAAGGPPFFTIHKKGQGKWTRLGTVFAAGLLGLLVTYNIYACALPYLPTPDASNPANHSADIARRILYVVCALFLGGFALLVFWLGNKPRNVDFLISTDSEMKKVNWTTKGELFGSTRVVVLFLVFIAMFLFVVDVIFQWFFHLIHVLQ